MNIKPIEILLVEDNPADVRLTQEVLKESKIANRVHVVQDGVEALEFLRKTGCYIDAVRPDLVLLDLNLPRKNGREVLAEIKADQDLKIIPVIVLTTSDAEADVLMSYDSHANAYIVKPLSFDQFVGIARSIENFWLSIVKLPRETC